MDNLDQRKDVSASKQYVRGSPVNRERIRQYWRVKDERNQRDNKRIRKKMVNKERRRQTKFNTTPVQHNIHKPQNYQRQIPPVYLPSPERFERNQFSNHRPRHDYDYDYDTRTRNDGYMTRRQNYAQPSRMSDSRRDRYVRNRSFDKRRSRHPYSNYNRSDTRTSSRQYNKSPSPGIRSSSRQYNKSPSPRIRSSSRQYNKSPSPGIHRRILSESPEPTKPTRSSEPTRSPGPTRSSEPTSFIRETITRINIQFASKSYLGKANVTFSSKDPLPKLLVLDLNGTLVYRANAKRDIILRPYMNRFMEYIFDSSNSFSVMVWSSAQPKNVDKMVKAAFGQNEKKLVAKWSRKNLNLSEQDYYQKVETIKDLEKVWRELNKNKSTTFPQIEWNQTNTILIDDSSVKAKLQPYNAIHLPDFDSERCNSNKDRELYNVIDYLRKLHNQSNVSAYIKNFPYTPPNDNKE